MTTKQTCFLLQFRCACAVGAEISIVLLELFLQHLSSLVLAFQVPI